MYNYSQLIKEEGLTEGMYNSICSLMVNMSISMVEAMRLLNIPESEYTVFQSMKESSI